MMYVIASSVLNLQLAKKEDVAADYVIHLISLEDLYYC
jgi:hypothetical protein